MDEDVIDWKNSACASHVYIAAWIWESTFYDNLSDRIKKNH